MTPLTTRRFPRYATTADPEIITTWTQAQMSYQGLLTSAGVLSTTYTASPGNAVILGGVLPGARIIGFRHLDLDTTKGRWTYRDGVYRPYEGSAAHSAITECVHPATALPGRPAEALSGTTDAGAPSVSRGALQFAQGALYSAYPFDPEPEFTTEPIGRGWSEITAEQWAAVQPPSPESPLP